MGLLSEFRDFAVKGNAADMAVGIIIGAAFNKIVTSLVNDVIMPPIGMLWAAWISGICNRSSNERAPWLQARRYLPWRSARDYS